MRTKLLVATALAITACQRQGHDSSDTSSTNNGNLPEILQGLGETESCANAQVDGCPFGAATDYLAGVYDIANDGTVQGQEYWYWIPNDTLAAQSADWEQGVACTLVWDYYGNVNDSPADCSGCLYTLEGDASFSASQSDCPQGLEDAEGKDQNGLIYKVRSASGNNAIQVFFPPSYSTDHAADGTATNSHLEWLSSASCEFVGSAQCR